MKAGADVVINTRKEDFVARVKEWTGGRGADVVINNLAGDVLPKSIDAVWPLGVVVAYGFAAGSQVTFDIRNLFFAEKQLRGSMASCQVSPGCEQRGRLSVEEGDGYQAALVNFRFLANTVWTAAEAVKAITQSS